MPRTVARPRPTEVTRAPASRSRITVTQYRGPRPPRRRGPPRASRRAPSLLHPPRPRCRGAPAEDTPALRRRPGAVRSVRMGAPPIVGDCVRAFLAAPGRFATLAAPSTSPGRPARPSSGTASMPTGGSRSTARTAGAGRRTCAVMRAAPWPSSSGADGVRLRRPRRAASSSVVDDQEVAQADIAAWPARYHADDPRRPSASSPPLPAQHRVSFRIEIIAVHDHLED